MSCAGCVTHTSLFTTAPPGNPSPSDSLSLGLISGSHSYIARPATPVRPHVARIEDLKRVITSQSVMASTHRNEHISLLELLGEGTFGKVYRGNWRGREMMKDSRTDVT